MSSKASWISKSNIPKGVVLFTLGFLLWTTPTFGLSSTDLSTYVQTGFEYDSNVFKTFGSGNSDFLNRLLLTHKGNWATGETAKLFWKYHGGGKIFFTEEDQNLLIQYIEGTGVFRLSSYVSLDLFSSFKYQDENDDVDAAGLDINEDFISPTGKGTLHFNLPFDLRASIFGEYTFFKFFPQNNFSFHRERFGFNFRSSFARKYLASIFYNQSHQQFQFSARSDVLHQVGALFQYVSVPFLSLRYAYQYSNSNDDIFSFRNHRVSFLMSVPLLDHNGEDSKEYDVGNGTLLGLHVLATIQRKRFPAVFGTSPEPTTEGQRFLLTDSEDDNFNSTLIKLTLHPTDHWAIEGKYTIYSNALSSQESDFDRSLLYLGARYLF